MKLKPCAQICWRNHRPSGGDAPSENLRPFPGETRLSQNGEPDSAYRLSGPRSRREEVGSLARVYARFAPNFGRGPEARRVRQTSPPDAAGTQWLVGNG